MDKQEKARKEQLEKQKQIIRDDWKEEIKASNSYLKRARRRRKGIK